jgi:hypothetical protein
VAGFTTLAYCADFTQQTTTNNIINGVSQTMVWTTLANWLDCAGASSPQWILNNNIGHSNSCGAFSVANDPSAGSNVLQMTVTPANGSLFTAGIGTAGSGKYYMTYPGTNNYAEIKYRLNAAEENNIPPAGRGNVVLAYWSWYASPCGVEVDFIETFGGTGGNQGLTDWCGSSGTSGQSSLTAPALDSNYHVFGSLNTSNGSSGAFGQCGYADGVAAVTTCQSKIPSNSAEYLQGSWLLLWNNAAQSATLTGNLTAYIEWIRVWTKSGCFAASQASYSSSCAATNVYTGTPP